MNTVHPPVTGMREVPRSMWRGLSDARRVGVWLGSGFLAQLFHDGDGADRLTVNRTTVDASRTTNGQVHWLAGIAWDELMQVKRDCGFADRWAVEVYPADEHVVDVANMRHLWLLREKPSFAWTKEQR